MLDCIFPCYALTIMNTHPSSQIKASVKRAYDAIADQFSQTRQQPWGEFEDFLPHVKKGDRVLDVGCGNGRLYAFLKERVGAIDYTGVDQSGGLLTLAKKQHPEAEFLEQDMEELQVDPDQFDVVFSIASFHHLPTVHSRRETLKRMHQALKKDGVLILTVWNLFQRKYLAEFLRAIGSFLIRFGQGLRWNDLWIKWAKYPEKRYYHAFLPGELRRYFDPSQWMIEQFYFTRKGKRVGFWKGFNLVMAARKK